jgi:hypothetical protein
MPRLKWLLAAVLPLGFACILNLTPENEVFAFTCDQDMDCATGYACFKSDSIPGADGDKLRQEGVKNVCLELCEAGGVQCERTTAVCIVGLQLASDKSSPGCVPGGGGPPKWCQCGDNGDCGSTGFCAGGCNCQGSVCVDLAPCDPACMPGEICVGTLCVVRCTGDFETGGARDCPADKWHCVDGRCVGCVSNFDCPGTTQCLSAP